MSDNELYYFLIMQWQNNVYDIREQYPALPLPETIGIAGELGINHPPANKSIENKTVLTTDFVITVKTDNLIHDIYRTVKTVDDLKKERTIEKLMIEREFYRRKGVDWGIIRDCDIPKIMGINIYFIYNNYFWGEDSGLSQGSINEIIYRFKNCLIQNNLDVLKTAHDFEIKMHWYKGEGLNFFKYLLARREIHTDMNIKFNFHTMKVWI